MDIVEVKASIIGYENIRRLSEKEKIAMGVSLEKKVKKKKQKNEVKSKELCTPEYKFIKIRVNKGGSRKHS